MIWECFSILAYAICFNYCCTTHTKHGNMVFSKHCISLNLFTISNRTSLNISLTSVSSRLSRWCLW